MRWFKVVALLSLFVVARLAPGQETLPDLKSGSVAIEADLAELSHPQFQVREAATRRLILRKLAAVEPLTRLAEEGKTEASVRAFEILRQLYRDADEATAGAVEVAFEKLANSDNVSAAARAESSINSVAQKWHRRAIETFVKLGGGISYLDLPAPEEGQEEEKSERHIKYAFINKNWSGGDAGLKYLRRIDDFRAPLDPRGPALYIVKGTVSKEAVAALEAALPNLHVAERGPACFGISPVSRFAQAGGLPQNGLQVEQVTKGSAADRAGLQPLDWIQSFNGHKITTFEGLVEKIAEKEPGDKVPVIYSRDGVEQTVVVELRPWETEPR